MTSITEEMQKLIEESLPGATAGAMKDFIKEAELTKSNLMAAQHKINDLDLELDKKSKEISRLKEVVSKAGDLDNREQSLNERNEGLDVRERDINLEIATIKLESAEKRNASVEGLVNKVFGHPSVTVSTTKDVPVATGGSRDCVGFPVVERGIQETTITTEGKF